MFHVHNEHEFHLHSEEWIQKIKAKELEMIAWQQANLDIIIPGLLLHLIEDNLTLAVMVHILCSLLYGPYDRVKYDMSDITRPIWTMIS